MTSEVRIEWTNKRPPALPDPPRSLIPRPCFAEPADGRWTNRLIQGDNLEVMAALLPELAGQFDLIYLDPPFFTGKEWRARSRSAPFRAPSVIGHADASLSDRGIGPNLPEAAQEPPATSLPGAADPIENRKLKIENPPGFSDDWPGGLGEYLQWLYDRLAAVKALLAPTGCLYLHLSWHSAHYARLLLDELFGAERFQNEIAWCYREAINSKKRWNRKHDTLLFYSKGEEFTFNHDLVREPYSESTIKKFRGRDEKGPYRLMGRGITGSPLCSKRDLPAEMETLFPELTYRHYLGEGTLPVDYWHIDIENQASSKRTGYPTQKPEALLERVLLASSNEGDLIGDFCCGSGTTLVVAERLCRRWIGCDAGAHAIDISATRLASMRAGFTQHLVGGSAAGEV